MRVLIKKRLSSGKTDTQLVDMKPKLYKYLSKKKSEGAFKSNKAIKKAGIVDFQKPSRKFGNDGSVWNWDHLKEQKPVEDHKKVKKHKKVHKLKSYGKKSKKSKKSKRSKKRRSFK